MGASILSAGGGWGGGMLVDLLGLLYIGFSDCGVCVFWLCMADQPGSSFSLMQLPLVYEEVPWGTHILTTVI